MRSPLNTGGDLNGQVSGRDVGGGNAPSDGQSFQPPTSGVYSGHRNDLPLEVITVL